MNTEPQADAGMNHLAHQLHHHRVAMLTLHERGVGLTSRPMTPLEMDADGAIWFMVSREAMESMIGEPGDAPEPVNLSFRGTHPEKNEGDYVSVTGVAESVDDAQRKEALWSALARPWFDGPADPDLLLLKVTPWRAEIWDGPDSVLARTLNLAASVAAGRPIGMGHREHVTAPDAPGAAHSGQRAQTARTQTG